MSNLAPSSNQLRSDVRKQSAYQVVRIAVTLVAVCSVLFSAVISAGGNMHTAARLLTIVSGIVGAVIFNGLCLAILDIADSALLTSHKPRSGAADTSAGPARDGDPEQ